MENKINILVTGIGGDIGIGIINILNEIKYHSMLVGCDMNEYPATKDSVDIYHNVVSAKNEMIYLNQMLLSNIVILNIFGGPNI